MVQLLEVLLTWLSQENKHQALSILQSVIQLPYFLMPEVGQDRKKKHQYLNE